MPDYDAPRRHGWAKIIGDWHGRPQWIDDIFWRIRSSQRIPLMPLFSRTVVTGHKDITPERTPGQSAIQFAISKTILGKVMPDRCHY